MIDLRVRLVTFSKSVIVFSKSLPQDTISRPLISQLVKSSTSIGANYCEAQSGISRADFRAKIYISQKEAEETKYWFELMGTVYPDREDEIKILQIETQEIIKILQAIINKVS